MLEKYDATYIIKNEVLQITTNKAASSPKNLQTRIYGVEELVQRLEEVFDSDKPQVVVEFDPLIELIENTIHPNSWLSGGDGDGTISGYETAKMKVLVISQTPKVHKSIEHLLVKLLKYQNSRIKKKEAAKPKK